MKALGLAAALLLAAGGTASAGVIERACMKSDRPAANRSLCGCIQSVADATLTRGEQRRAAKFFSDPHMAQVVRQSDVATDEMFWKRYKAFGATASNYCS